MTKSSTVLIALLVILTFPIWIGIAGGLFGLLGGLIGAFFGIIGAVFGAIFGLIGSIFEIIFGSAFHWHRWPGYHFSSFCTFALIILVVALAIQSRRKSK